MASLDGDRTLQMNETGVRRRLMIALMTMTVVTGFEDAVSFLGLGHVFTASIAAGADVKHTGVNHEVVPGNLV